MTEPLGGAIVIVGAGQAGISCATALRRGGWSGAITLVGRELHPPYERPPLSKKVLTGALDPAALTLADEDALAKLDLTHERVDVIAIDRDARRVTLADGRALHYEHLVLATGAVPRSLPASLPGAEAVGVHVIRTIDDAVDIAARLGSAADIVVVGGGFIGVEVAGALAGTRRVTLIEAVPSLLARVAPPEVGSWVAAHLEGLGVRVVTETGVAGIVVDEAGQVVGVRDSRSEVHPADLVIVGIGAQPDADLAAASGLEVDPAVVVDGSLTTRDPAISAIGDCAAQIREDGSRHRYESVQSAQDQARYVAKRLLGATTGPYDEVPWFWSDIGQARVQMAGRIDLALELVPRGDPQGAAFSLFGYDGDTLVGVCSINRTPDYMAGRMLLSAGRSPAPAQVADLSVDLRQLARDAS